MKRKTYPDWYRGVVEFFEEHPHCLVALKSYNRLMTVLMPLVFLGLLFLVGWERFWLYSLVPATGFVLLSMTRKWLNRPRPYENWGTSPLLEKDSQGQSMPSRHVFSATVISMVALHASTGLGIILLLLSLGLALVRVLGGVHYLSDVLVGYLCGLVWGLLLFLI